MSKPWLFYNDCSRPLPGPSSGGSISLETIWDVDAEATYVVPVEIPRRRCLTAIRTIAGHGRIVLDPGGRLTLQPETLLVVENQRIRHYNCEGERWRFWWFEFTTADVPFFPLHHPVPVPNEAADSGLLLEIFAALRRPAFTQRSLASAGFSFLMHRWLAHWQGRQNISAHQAALERVVDGMHGHRNGTWTVAEMAREAHLSERRFRQVFEEAMGQTPKRFYDGLRLEHGRELLRLGTQRVSEVAEKLGFSSPFHFSRAFRERFGTPPSSILTGEDAENGERE